MVDDFFKSDFMFLITVKIRSSPAFKLYCSKMDSLRVFNGGLIKMIIMVVYSLFIIIQIQFQQKPFQN